MKHFYVIHPDGRRETRELPADEDARLDAQQDAVGSLIEYVSPAFHGLVNHDVIINEEGSFYLPPNPYGSRHVGLDSKYAPWHGPIVIVPREEGSNAHERDAETAWFRAHDMLPEAS